MIKFLLPKHGESKFQSPADEKTRERTADLHLNKCVHAVRPAAIWNNLSVCHPSVSLSLSGWESVSLFSCQLKAAFDCLHLYSCVHSIYHLLLTLPPASLYSSHSSLIFIIPMDNFHLLFILFMLG